MLSSTTEGGEIEVRISVGWPLYLSSTLYCLVAPQFMFSEPYVMSSPLYSEPIRTLTWEFKVMSCLL
uniref:Uncharacterized protein n=1 Tax=Timema tahoe TaxID=61484 RepID=A0A7R9IC34_9NEOP|nr:unnamed protein product [Timema tahoe]